MPSNVRYQALGPLLSGEGSRAFLGLEIRDEQRAHPIVLVWVPDAVADAPPKRLVLEKETARAEQLEHPNILRVHGLVTLDEGLARVVEFADGETLRKIIDTAGRLAPEYAAKIVADACLGVHFAHVAGNDDGTPLLHGDLRPETIVISFAGTTKVTGYGALSVAPAAEAAEVGRQLHLAPEQLISGRESATVRTDVYLLGLMLYECLTGQIPFNNEGDFERAVLSEGITFPTESPIPQGLQDVVKRALAKKAPERFATPLEMREAIEQAISPLPETSAVETYLATFIPEGEPARAARRRVVDNGIADFARRQWDLASKAALAARDGSPAPAAAAPATAAPPSDSVMFEPTAVRKSSAEIPVVADVEFTAPATVNAGEGSSYPPPPPDVALISPSEALDVPPPSRTKSSSGARAVRPFVPEPEPVSGKAPVVSKRKPWKALVGVAAVAALVIVGVMQFRKAGPSPQEAASTERASLAPTAPAAPATAPTPAVTPTPPAAGTEAEDPGMLGAIDPPSGDEPSTPAAAPGVSGLSLKVQPPVTVEINGKPAGRSPVQKELPPGRYRVALKDKAKGISVLKVLTVKSGNMTEEEIFIGKGYVTLNAPPGALISFDGKLAGKAPAKKEFELFEGNHRVGVIFSGARWTETFKLESGERLHFDVTTD